MSDNLTLILILSYQVVCPSVHFISFESFLFFCPFGFFFCPFNNYFFLSSFSPLNLHLYSGFQQPWKLRYAPFLDRKFSGFPNWKSRRWIQKSKQRTSFLFSFLLCYFSMWIWLTWIYFTMGFWLNLTLHCTALFLQFPYYQLHRI